MLQNAGPCEREIANPEYAPHANHRARVCWWTSIWWVISDMSCKKTQKQKPPTRFGTPDLYVRLLTFLRRSCSNVTVMALKALQGQHMVQGLLSQFCWGTYCQALNDDILLSHVKPWTNENFIWNIPPWGRFWKTSPDEVSHIRTSPVLLPQITFEPPSRNRTWSGRPFSLGLPGTTKPRDGLLPPIRYMKRPLCMVWTMRALISGEAAELPLESYRLAWAPHYGHCATLPTLTVHPGTKSSTNKSCA